MKSSVKNRKLSFKKQINKRIKFLSSHNDFALKNMLLVIQILSVLYIIIKESNHYSIILELEREREKKIRRVKREEFQIFSLSYLSSSKLVILFAIVLFHCYLKLIDFNDLSSSSSSIFIRFLFSISFFLYIFLFYFFNNF